MISKFSLVFGKPKKALCSVFSGRNISEFNNSFNLDKEILLDCRSKKGALGFHFPNYEKNKEVKKQF